MNAMEKFEQVDIAEERLVEAKAILADIGTQIEQDAAGIVIASGDDKELATYILKDIKTISGGLEERRKFLVSPLNGRVKEINEFFKGCAATFETSDKLLRGKILAFERKAEEERRKKADELQRAEAAKKKADEDAAQAAKANDYKPDPAAQAAAKDAEQKALAAREELRAVEKPQRARYDGAKATTKLVWTFQILSAAEIPIGYMRVDETAIRAAIRTGVREIPGVRIYQDQQLSIS